MNPRNAFIKYCFIIGQWRKVQYNEVDDEVRTFEVNENVAR